MPSAGSHEGSVRNQRWRPHKHLHANGWTSTNIFIKDRTKRDGEAKNVDKKSLQELQKFGPLCKKVFLQSEIRGL